jgi:hypothetical protein
VLIVKIVCEKAEDFRRADIDIAILQIRYGKDFSTGILY